MDWKVAEAKQRFSELLREAVTEPQLIHNRSRLVAVVVGAADNAIALEQGLMNEIEAWGKPQLLIVPNGWHRLDSAIFEQRYPDLKLVCPAGARAKVEQVVGVDHSYADAPADALVSFQHLDGTNETEGVMRVESDDGVTLVLNDVLFNVRDLPGLEGLVMRLLGSTGGPKVTRISRLFVIKDKPALRAHLERLATDDVVRVVPGHGEIIELDAAKVLRQVAATL
jgi:prevent-host-death family protein